ncbi:hypothetical protein LCGC14_0415720 [marine sediment metagenome]|uniref:Uncharacterized protein n=1 Tax=marine sediment metagenome TaxID=412755 RepID=A0A0F9VED7_9ZZZZ
MPQKRMKYDQYSAQNQAKCAIKKAEKLRVTSLTTADSRPADLYKLAEYINGKCTPEEIENLRSVLKITTLIPDGRLCPWLDCKYHSPKLSSRQSYRVSSEMICHRCKGNEANRNRKKLKDNFTMERTH